MATWKKVITEDSAAALASLTLTAALPVAQGGTGTTTIGGIKTALGGIGTAAAKATGFFATAAQGTKADDAQPVLSEGAFDNGDKTKLDGLSTQGTTTAALALKAPLASPEFTGTIQLPNYSDVESTLDGIATNASAISGNDTDISANTTLANTKLAKASNLSDLASTSTARGNLGLGNVANENRATILGGNLTGTVDGTAVATIKSGAAAGLTANQSDTATILGGNLTGTIGGVSNADIRSGAALGATANQDETATIQAGTTAANVDLGNVTNESKTTMFASPAFTGVAGAAALTTSGNVIIGGTLTVSGATTTVNTETINLADNFIKLNSNWDANDAPTQEAGISVSRGTSNDANLFWDEGAVAGGSGRWAMSLADLGDAATASAPDAFVQVIQTGTTTPASYAAPLYGGTAALGTMYVKTDDPSGANIYIYA